MSNPKPYLEMNPREIGEELQKPQKHKIVSVAKRVGCYFVFSPHMATAARQDWSVNGAFMVDADTPFAMWQYMRNDNSSILAELMTEMAQARLDWVKAGLVFFCLYGGKKRFTAVVVGPFDGPDMVAASTCPKFSAIAKGPKHHWMHLHLGT